MSRSMEDSRSKMDGNLPEGRRPSSEFDLGRPSQRDRKKLGRGSKRVPDNAADEVCGCL